MPILCIFTPTFSFFRIFCLLYKTSKIVSSRSIFRLYDMGIQGLQGVTRGDSGWHGVKGGYNGLQRVTKGYKGLQGVTKGYKGLKGVTRGEKGLQRVTKDYRNFFLTSTFQDTFSWSILRKNQIKEISNFWRKRRTNPFGKMLILRFS